jgi:hypothetical protein
VHFNRASSSGLSDRHHILERATDLLFVDVFGSFHASSTMIYFTRG